MGPSTITPLNALDRCDRCGAQARLTAVLRSGTLLFCQHHGQLYMSNLVAVAMAVHLEAVLVGAQP